MSLDIYKYYQKIGISMLISRRRKKLFISIEHYLIVIIVLLNHLAYLMIAVSMVLDEIYDIPYSKTLVNSKFSFLIILTGFIFYYFKKCYFNKNIILKLYKSYFYEKDLFGKAVLYGIFPNLIILIIVLINYIFTYNLLNL